MLFSWKQPRKNLPNPTLVPRQQRFNEKYGSTSAGKPLRTHVYHGMRDVSGRLITSISGMSRYYGYAEDGNEGPITKRDVKDDSPIYPENENEVVVSFRRVHYPYATSRSRFDNTYHYDGLAHSEGSRFISDNELAKTLRDTGTVGNLNYKKFNLLEMKEVRALTNFLYVSKGIYYTQRNITIYPHISVSREEMLDKCIKLEEHHHSQVFTNCYTREAAIANLFAEHDIRGNTITINNTNHREDSFWETIHQDEEKNNFNVVRRFHGTSVKAALSILKNGFNLGYKGCAFGSGIYFGLWEKASSFRKSIPLQKHHTVDRESLGLNKRALSNSCILEVDLNLGSCLSDTDGEDNLSYLKGLTATWGEKKTAKILDFLKSKNCDSLHYSGFQNPEWVIYNPSRVIVRKIHLGEQNVY